MADKFFILFAEAEETFDTKEKAAEVATDYVNKYRNNYVIAKQIGEVKTPTTPVEIDWS